MAGTLFGLGLSQQVDAEGVPLSGALLYIYEENSSTPVTTYSDFSLSTAQTFPIEADSAGRLPQIWVANGNYRARLTTAAGVEVFDEASVTAIGASATVGTGGGSSVDSTTIFQTGDTLWVPVTGARTGWVRCNARTISSGSGSGTERANSDTQDLFEHLWNTFSNSICPVGGGRGASAAADFSANKAIATPDMRGRAPFGLDDMGNSAAGTIAAGTPTALSNGGAETVTIQQTNLPNVTLSSSGLSGVVGTSITNGSSVCINATTDGNLTGGGAGSYVKNVSTASLSLASSVVTISGSVPLGGSGTATNKMPPYMLGTWYIKL